MSMLSWGALLASWAGFFYPFIFHAPHWQKRGSVTASGATLAGILLEAVAICTAWAMGVAEPLPWWRTAAGFAVAPVGPALAFWSVRHLGRQFRIRAGLWDDHELIRTGPYALVRHPIYAALLAEVVTTLLLRTRWPWWAVALPVFLAGTEIRVSIEDKLLASRFGAEFEEYRRRVRAYLPGVR